LDQITTLDSRRHLVLPPVQCIEGKPINYLQRLESKGVHYVSYQEQRLDTTGPFRDVVISMFATLAKQERARISERTIAGLKVARAKGKRLGDRLSRRRPSGPFFP
jgi:DNA invertase Pin-like site-specific DNA recombinase